MGRPKKIKPSGESGTFTGERPANALRTLARQDETARAALAVPPAPAPADVLETPVQAAVFAALSTPQEPNDLELALAQAAMLESDVPVLSDVGPGLAVEEYDELVTIHNRMQCKYHLLHIDIPSGESREVSANFLRTVIHRREIAFLFENGDLEATQ